MTDPGRNTEQRQANAPAPTPDLGRVDVIAPNFKRRLSGVTSTVVRLIPRAKPLADCEPADLEAVTAIAFGQRRKMLRASFKAYGGADFIEAAGLEPSSRPQEVPIEGFCALARLYHEHQKER